MTKKRKIGICALLFLMATSCAVVGACAKEEPSTSESGTALVGFENATVAADYKAEFTLGPYLTAIDDKGNVYKGTAEVKDADGNKVEVFANRFKLTEVDDYTANISVEFNGETHTRELTIDVLDKTMPIISLSAVNVFKGVEYTPQIEVFKVSGEVIVPEITVYFLGGEKAETVTVENGSFTAQKVGLHKIIVTAKDQYGIKNMVEQEFYVRSFMEKNVLENFTDEISKENVLISKTGATYTTLGDFYTTWHESKDGRNGVVETITTDGGRYGMGKVGLRFHRAVEELANMQFDYISVWVWIDADTPTGGFSARSQNCILQKEIQGRTWQEIRIYKENITATNAFWYNNKSSYKDAWDKFANTHSASGTGDYLFCIKLDNGTMTGETLTSQADSLKIYIDSISYGNIEIAEYTQPSLNETFTLPTAKLLDETGAMLTSNCEITAELLGVGELTQNDGKIAIAYAGDYIITYRFTYGGLTYTEELTFNIPRVMAQGVLEDFDTLTSKTNVRNGEKGLTSTTTSTWQENATDSAGTTKTGVVKITLNPGDVLWVNFNKTLEELNAVDANSWDYISVMILVERDAYGAGGSYKMSNWSNGFNYSNKVWTEMKITKDLINGVGGNTIWSAKNPNDPIAELYNRHNVNGTGNYLFQYPTNATGQAVVYIDQIAFAKN